MRRICLDHLSGKVFEVLFPNSEVVLRCVCVCVLSVPLVVLAVIVPFSDVNMNVVCNVVFTDSDCELVEPQTISLSRKREASVVLESETEKAMDADGVNSPWTAREGVLIAKVEQYLEKSESIQVEISELEHFLLGPEDADISITSFAENARDEGGQSKFVLLDTPRGKG